MSVTTQANTTRITSDAVTIQWYANTPVYWAGYKLAGQSEYTEVYNDLNRIGNYVGYFTIKELTEETYYTATVKLIAVDGTILEADYPTVSFTTPALGDIAADIQTKLLGNDTVLVNWQTNIGINSLEYTINSEGSVEVPVTAGFTTGSFYINGIYDQDELTITLANSSLSQTITLTVHITNADYIETNKDRTLPAIEVDINNLLFPYIYYDPSEKSRGKLTALEWNTIMHLLIHQGNYTAKALNTLDLDILKVNPHAIMIMASQLDLDDTSENNVQAKLTYLQTEYNDLKAGGLADSSIATAKLQDTAITTTKIADTAVTTAKIEDDAITTDKIADDSITMSKIPDASITSVKLHADTKKAENLTATAISATDTSDPNIQAKLNHLQTQLIEMIYGGVADNSITNVKLVDGTITNSKIADGTIINSKISDGTISKTKLDTSLQEALMPIGAIIMWSGNTIPNRWHLCDGTNGTPDLRNRFIVGAGDEYSIGNTGGEKEHTLITAELPVHNHTIEWDISVATSSPVTRKTLHIDRDPLKGSSIGARTWPDYNTFDTNNTGNGQAHENRPPYYALAYIMKIS